MLEKLKNADPRVKSARAEAYGENCIAEDGSLVRFAARETDFYVTFKVENLQDEAALAGFLGWALWEALEGRQPPPQPERKPGKAAARPGQKPGKGSKG